MSKNMQQAETNNNQAYVRKAKYDPEFKASVLEVWNSGIYATMVDCAKNYGIKVDTLYNWVYNARKTNSAPQSHSPEVMALKKELASTKMELEVLKKAAIYFANHAR